MKDYIQEVLDDLKAQFQKKTEEYQGTTGDRYRNFNQGAALQSETPEQTLLGYVNKQIVSLLDAKHHNPERLTDRAFVDEKAGDVCLYMVLLIAMVREKTAEFGFEGIPRPEYRLLVTGDLIMASDEYQLPDGTWKPLLSYVGEAVWIYDERYYLPMRRKI